MNDKIKLLKNLHDGHVIFRGEKKERVVITTPRNVRAPYLEPKRCEFCDTNLTGVKCVRHDKGNCRLFHECFQCYTITLKIS